MSVSNQWEKSSEETTEEEVDSAVEDPVEALQEVEEAEVVSEEDLSKAQVES